MTLDFRHLLETNDLAPEILSRINAYPSRKGLMLKGGSIVDATIISAPSTTKNASIERDPRCTKSRRASSGVCVRRSMDNPLVIYQGVKNKGLHTLQALDFLARPAGFELTTPWFVGGFHPTSS